MLNELNFVQPSLLQLRSPDEQINPNIILFSDSRFLDTLEEFKNCKRFGYDIETFAIYNEVSQQTDKKAKENKDALNPFVGYIRLIQVALESGKTIIADLGGRNSFVYNWSKELSDFADVLKQKLWDENVEVVGFNLKFDLLYTLHHLGFPARNVRDCMLMSQIYWSGIGVIKLKKGGDRTQRCLLPHNLKSVAARLGLDKVDKSEQKSNWAWNLTNKQLNYAALDAQIVLKIDDILKPKIKAAQLEYSIEAEHKALPVFVEMEYFGYPIDTNLLDKLLEDYGNAQNFVLLEWESEFPRLPWRATKKDLVPAINQRYGLAIEAADDENLAGLDLPAIKALLDARTLGISIKYLEKIKEQTHLNHAGQYTTPGRQKTDFVGSATPTNIIHESVRSKFRQIVTGWRSASGDSKGTGAPNLQNTPKLKPRLAKMGLANVRTVFKPPTGYKLLVVDLSAAHARIAAQMSGDPILIQAYKDGLDNHLLLAQRILKELGYNYSFSDLMNIRKDYKSKSKQGLEPTEEELLIDIQRDYAKTGFYAWLNQAGAATMQASFASRGVEVSVEYCELLKANLREIYKVLYDFIREQIKKANGYSCDISKFSYLDVTGKPLKGNYGKIHGLTGGRSYCLKMSNTKFNRNVEEVAFTDTVSLMWLMSEASMIKSAMGKYRLESLANPEWDSYICNFAHDEINAIVKEEYASVAANCLGTIVRKELEQWITLFPVEEEGLDYNSFIVDDWSQK